QQLLAIGNIPAGFLQTPSRSWTVVQAPDHSKTIELTTFDMGLGFTLTGSTRSSDGSFVLKGVTAESEDRIGDQILEMALNGQTLIDFIQTYLKLNVSNYNLPQLASVVSRYIYSSGILGNPEVSLTEENPIIKLDDNSERMQIPSPLQSPLLDMEFY